MWLFKDIPEGTGLMSYRRRASVYRPTQKTRRKQVLRRKPYRKRGFYRKGYKTENTQELKFFDTSQVDTVVPTTGQILTSINLVSQGIAENQRIGRKIVIRSIAMRWFYNLQFQQDQPDIGGGDTLRIIVFLDKQANGAAASVSGILEATQIESYRNLANKNRFDILMDRKFTLNRKIAVTDGTNTSTTPLLQKFTQWYKRCEIPIEFDSTAGVIAEVRSYNVGLLYISQNGLIGVGTQQTRIRYDG